VRFGWVNSDGNARAGRTPRPIVARFAHLASCQDHQATALHLDELPIGTSRPTGVKAGHLPAPRAPPPQRAAAPVASVDRTASPPARSIERWHRRAGLDICGKGRRVELCLWECPWSDRLGDDQEGRLS
jgi:hypothetical protein